MKRIVTGAIIGGLIGVWLMALPLSSVIKGSLYGIVLSFAVTMAIREHRRFKEATRPTKNPPL